MRKNKKIEIRLTSIEEIIKYLESHPDSLYSIKTKVILIGYYLDGTLLSAGAFSYPRNKSDQKYYTTELLTLKSSLESTEDEIESYKDIIEYFKNKFEPSDILYKKDLEEKRKAKAAIKALTGSGFSEYNKEILHWINSKHSHYTYKITSPKSNKYYYGVRTIKIENASIQDCLKDKYLGSGSRKSSKNKFWNWKQKYKDTLVKEIIEIHATKARAYEHEKYLVGDLWKADPNCLNSISGGKSAFLKDNKKSIRFLDLKCSVHGITKHYFKSGCVKCIASKVFEVKNCSTHGDSKFRGNECLKCSKVKDIETINCSIHGKTTHINNVCLRCTFGDSITVKNCLIHGKSKHVGDKCFKCFVSKTIRIDTCQIHGLTNFRLNNCIKCHVLSQISLKQCFIHGVTKHQGETCSKCSMPDLKSKKCKTHGDSLHVGETCTICRAEASVSVKNCQIHGEVKFTGDKCRACVNNSSVNLKECEHHGLVKHQGRKCSSCTSQRVAHNRFHSKKSNPNCFLC